MWKATEFRQFLLYTGPVVLYKKLPMEMYENFMMLSTSVRLLLMSDKGVFSFTFLQDALEVFVRKFAEIYGNQVLTYNVHSLMHLVDDAKLFGSLDNISCFPFENYLGHLKKLVSQHLHKHPIAQIIRRLEEKHRVNMDCSENIESISKHKQQHFNGPVPNGFESYSQFKQYKSENLYISLLSNDNCFYIKDFVCIVRNIFGFSNLTFWLFQNSR